MAGKVRLHWFWRGALAAAVGCVLYGTIPPVEKCFQAPKLWLIGHIRHWLEPWIGYDWAIDLGDTFANSLLPVAVTLVIYGRLTYWFGPLSTDGELHCRRCDHILRGLSEPRCPECGEGI